MGPGFACSWATIGPNIAAREISNSFVLVMIFERALMRVGVIVRFQFSLKIAQLFVDFFHLGFEGPDSLLDFRMLVSKFSDGHVRSSCAG